MTALTRSSIFRTAGMLMLWLIASLPTTLLAAQITLVVDSHPSYAAFAERLRGLSAAPGARFTGVDVVSVARFVSDSRVATTLASRDDIDPGVASARTRSLPPSTRPPVSRRSGDSRVLVGLGAEAARALIQQRGAEPVLLARLGFLEYQTLQAMPAWHQARRPIGVLLEDPAPQEMLTLIDTVLPGKRRIGVAASAQANVLIEKLADAVRTRNDLHPQRSQPFWTLATAVATQRRELNAALQRVLPVSDTLLILPDPVGLTSTAALSVLQSAANANLPVFASSEALVRAGALAAVVPSEAPLAEQVYAMAWRLARATPGTSLVERPAQWTVRTNPYVAKRLGLVLLAEEELAAALARTR